MDAETDADRSPTTALRVVSRRRRHARDHAVRGLAWRAVLVVVACAAPVLGAPAAVTAPLTLVAVLTTAERLARHRRRGLLDLLTTGIGGVLAVTIIVGVALNLLPQGLTTASWAGAAAGVGLAGLACCIGRPVPPSALTLAGRDRATPAGLAWFVLSAAVVAGAVVFSVQVASADRTTPLQISATSTDPGRFEIRVDAGAARGPYELDRVDGPVRTVVVPSFDLAPGETAVFSVRVAAQVRATVELRRPGDSVPLRQLILDSSAP